MKRKMYENEKRVEVLPKGVVEQALLRKMLPMMKSELVGFTEETAEGLLFTLPGGKRYCIFAVEA
jgi:hypothetical protein